MQIAPKLQLTVLTASRGAVLTKTLGLDADGWRPTDLVVCRNNAPLVTLAHEATRSVRASTD